MKRYLIILFLLLTTLFSWGQIVQTNLNFLFNGSIDPIDSTLIDSITGISNPNFKVLDMDWDIVSNGIPQRTGARLVLFGDTIHIPQLFGEEIRNYNAADTLFFQIVDKVTGAFDTVVSQAKIQRIAYYSTSMSDVNNFFNATPLSPNGLTVGTGKTYDNIQLAYSAAVSGDTIYIFDRKYTSQTITNKDISIIGVGNSGLYSAAGFALATTQTINRLLLKSLYISSPTNTSMYMVATTMNDVLIKNCVTKNNFGFNSVYVKNFSDVTIEGSLIDGKSEMLGKIILKDTYFTNINNENYGLTFLNSSTNTYIDNCKLDRFLLGCVYTNSDTTFIKNTEITDRFSYDFANPNNPLNFYFKHCKFYSNNIVPINYSVADSVYINIDSCTFINNVNLSSSLITLIGQLDINFNNNTIYNYQDDFSVILATATEKRNAYINNNRAIGDSAMSYTFINYAVSANNNYISANYGGFSVSANSDVTDSIPCVFSSNEIHSKGENSQQLPFIRIGTEGDSESYGKMNGSIVTNNIFFGPNYYGNLRQSQHGVFIFAQNAKASYNYMNGVFLGYVIKHAGLDYYTVLNYNIVVNTTNSFLSKGAPNTVYYNNTSVNSLAYDFHLMPDNLYINSFSSNNKIINNLTELNTSSYNVYIDSVGDTTGLECNNNVFYSPINLTPFRIDGISYNYSTWQGLGYDANSFNTDPNLSVGLYPVYPSPAVGGGFNLGSTYREALNISSVWPDGIVYRNQVVPWTIGAFVVIRPGISTFNNGIWIYNGGGRYGTVLFK